MTSTPTQDWTNRPTDYSELVRPDRIHRRAYTDPEVFAAEMDRIFGATWVYLGHESEIPNPNDFVSTTVGTRPVILVRDRDGELTAVLNRCSHRGVTVCTLDRGNTQRFVCSYHGWAYSNTGELVNVPFPSRAGDDLDRGEWGLVRFDQVQSYRGFVFGVLRPGAPSLLEHLGAAAEVLDEWINRSPSGEITVVPPTRRVAARANWKLYLDGAADGLHAFATHRSFNEMSARHRPGLFLSQFSRDPDDTGMYSRVLGGGHQFLDQRPGMGPSAWEATRPVPGAEPLVETLNATMSAEQARSTLDRATTPGMNVFIFPNLSLVGNDIGVVTPVEVNRTEIHWKVTVLVGEPDDVLAVRMRIAEDFPNFGDPDDVENWERAQRGLESVPESEWLHSGRGNGPSDGDLVGVTDEAPMRSFHQEWARLMSSPGVSR